MGQLPQSDLPWVISVDDHVVEPPHVWTTWLPPKLRARGPHIEQDSCRTVEVPGTNNVSYERGGDGPVVDWWVYEDLIRPIPQVMACVGFPRDELTAAPIPFAAMRPGCYDPVARLSDMDLNRTERSMCFPSFPRFAGQVFLEAKDKDLALACVRAFNDWMGEEWCGPTGGRLIPLGLVPLWDPTLAAAEVRRNAARGFHAIAFTELPSNLGLPSIHDKDRFWDPLFTACDETGTVICMHIGSGSKMQNTSPDAPAGVVTALTSLNAVHVDGRLAALRRARPFPPAQDRLLGEPGGLDALPARAPRHRVHQEQGVVRPGPDHHRAAVQPGARQGLRLLLR